MDKASFVLGVIKEARDSGFSDNETMSLWNNILLSPSGKDTFDKLADTNEYPYTSDELELMVSLKKQAEAEDLYND